MHEQFIILQGLQVLSWQFMLIAGACCILILGTVFFLLFASDRTRAKGYEYNSRYKLGHEHLPEEVEFARGLWDR